MRWLKHLADASNNPLISKIQVRFGLAGYARYWKLIEAIAGSMKPGAQPILALPWPKWEAILCGRRKQLHSFLMFLESEGQIKLTATGFEPGCNPVATELQTGCNLFASEIVLEIVFPNIKKYRDEWSSRSGVARDKLPPKRQSTETDTDTDKKEAAELPPSWVRKPSPKASLPELKPLY